MNDIATPFRGVDGRCCHAVSSRRTDQPLVIRAAYGYQAPLMAAGRSTNGARAHPGASPRAKAFRANSLDTLAWERGSPKGKYDDLQGGKRPKSFYGLPLNVTGRKRPSACSKVEAWRNARSPTKTYC